MTGGIRIPREGYQGSLGGFRASTRRSALLLLPAGAVAAIPATSPLAVSGCRRPDRLCVDHCRCAGWPLQALRSSRRLSGTIAASNFSESRMAAMSFDFCRPSASTSTFPAIDRRSSRPSSWSLALVVLMLIAAPFQDEGSEDPETGDLGHHDGGPDRLECSPAQHDTRPGRSGWDDCTAVSL